MTEKKTLADKTGAVPRQAVEELQTSEERYRGLLTHLDAGVVVHAADTSVIGPGTQTIDFALCLKTSPTAKWRRRKFAGRIPY